MSKFHKFVPPKGIVEYGFDYLESKATQLANSDVSIWNDEGSRKAAGVAVYFNWHHAREPYYRVYPGVMESLLKIDLKKLVKMTLPPLPFGLTTLEIEIPESFWDVMGCKSIIFQDIVAAIRDQLDRDPDVTLWGVAIQDINDSMLSGLVDKDSVLANLENGRLPDDNSINFLKILYGVVSIGENPDIVRPMVLSKDRHKYECTDDPEEKARLVDRARRRGVHGFAVGEDIPTQAEFKKMLEENAVALKKGQKAPHFRRSYLAGRWKGKGRTRLEIVKVSAAIVNEHLMYDVPQGFHIE